MKRHRKRKFLPIAMQTDNFRLEPVKPLSFALKTFAWTELQDEFFNLGWRTSGWTMRRWWRHLRRRSEGDQFLHAIYAKSSDMCIGLHSTSLSLHAKNASLSILIADKAWRGKGVASEVKMAFLDDCFGRLQLERVATEIFSNNLSSIRLQLRLGFVHEGTSRSCSVGMNGERLDIARFGMLKAEWEQRRKGGEHVAQNSHAVPSPRDQPANLA